MVINQLYPYICNVSTQALQIKMRALRIIGICLFILACKKTNTEEAGQTTEKSFISEVTQSDISKLKYTEFVPDSEIKLIVANWPEYIQLEEQVTYIKKGDLNFFKDNNEAIKTLFKGLYENIPQEINDNSILARIKVVETTFYKLESLKSLSTTTKAEMLEGIKAFLIAMNNFHLQMNKIIELKNQNIIKP